MRKYISIPNVPASLVSEVKPYVINKIPNSEKPSVGSSAESAKIFRSIYDVNDIDLKEYFFVMCLNQASKVNAVVKIGEGSINSCVADVAEILRAAIMTNSRFIICCHNHLSGQLKASDSDKAITKRVSNAADLMGLKLLDHIILTSESYYSLADNGDF